MPLIALGHLALITDWWLGNWCLGVRVPVRFKPGIDDNTDTTPTRLAPPTLRPIELTALCLWCLYVLERPRTKKTATVILYRASKWTRHTVKSSHS